MLNVAIFLPTAAMLCTAFLLPLPAASAEASVGPFHPQCAEAFNELPIDQFGRPVENGAAGPFVVRKRNLKKHFWKHRDLYLNYDKRCFFGWGDLSENSRQFLEGFGGVLFSDQGNGLQPICSAFRIKKNMIMTAAHCIAPLMKFSLLASPGEMLDVKKIQYIGDSRSDLKDYAVLEIENTPIPFTLTLDRLTTSEVNHQVIAIVAISIPIYAINKLTPSQWIHAVRFSRVNASQLWPASELDPPLSDSMLLSRCLYYRAPTFPGMSGAAILGIRPPQSASQPPFVFVVGMHLRNGVPKSTCGEYQQFNIGARLSRQVREYVISNNSELRDADE